jgi:hypothetical protein
MGDSERCASPWNVLLHRMMSGGDRRFATHGIRFFTKRESGS